MDKFQSQLLLLVSTLIIFFSSHAGVVAGFIKTDNGRPVEGARINAWDKDTAKSELLGRASTDKNGRYTIHFKDKRWDGFDNSPDMKTNRPDVYITVEIKIRGRWEEIGRSKVHQDYDTTQALTINLDKIDRQGAFVRRTIFGSVVDKKGNPIADLVVKAWDKDFGTTHDLMGTAKTDAKGNYWISYANRRWDGPQTGIFGNAANPDIYVTLSKPKSTGVMAQSAVHQDHPPEKSLKINFTLK